MDQSTGGAVTWRWCGRASVTIAPSFFEFVLFSVSSSSPNIYFFLIAVSIHTPGSSNDMFRLIQESSLDLKPSNAGIWSIPKH